ncbi:hypothetical protein FRC09_018713, partial [Ceratobasidium sp. 395]
MVSAQVAEGEVAEVDRGCGLEPESSDDSPRKRARNDKEMTRAPKKDRKLNLSRILDMPSEVFNEIVTHLTPPDLLSLAQLNKFFRKMFMSRSSQSIWQTTFSNIPKLPECPSNMCEPQYVSLIWSKTCSKCGAKVSRRIDPYLLVRYCNTCRDEEVREFEADNVLLDLMPHSNSAIKPPKSGYTYVLCRDVDSLKQIAPEKPDEWFLNKAQQIEKQQAHSAMLQEFLEVVELERENELRDLKTQRQKEYGPALQLQNASHSLALLCRIESRLLENGWTKREMTP